MKRLIASLALAACLAAAQEKPVPAPDPKDAQIAALTAKNAWLEKQVNLLAQKLDTIGKWYAIEDALRAQEASKPKDPPAPVAPASN